MFFLTVSLVDAKLVPSQKVPWIIGGSDTTINQHPYIASVKSSGTHVCCATLIADTSSTTFYLLTVAHCVKGQTANNVVVDMGSTYRTNSDGQGRQFTVSAFYVHSGYDNGIVYILVNHLYGSIIHQKH